MNMKIGWIMVSASGIMGGCNVLFDLYHDPAGPPVDAAVLPDAPAPLPDASCDWPGSGNGGCDRLNPFGAPNGEGGEVRIELFQEGEGQSRLAARAYFFKGQDPLVRPLIGEPINDMGATQGYDCFAFKSGDLYNNGASPRHHEIADTRTYLDVGDAIALSNRDNVDDSMVLLEQPEGTADPASHIQHDIVYVGAGDEVPAPASLYAWELDGASYEYPAFHLVAGASAATNSWLAEGVAPDVYFPQQFTMTSPAEADYFAGPLAFTRGESFTFTWENAADEHADSPGTISFVSFWTEGDEVEAWCARPGDEGRFVVPPEVFDYVSPTGKLLVGKFSHTGWLQAGNSDFTRIDLVGLNSKLSSYEVVDP